MDILSLILKIIIGLGIYNVWILRFNKPTKYRGRDSKNMVEEFKTYGLPKWSVYVIGFLKLIFATGILLSIWVDGYLNISIISLSILMFGAILSHLKVRDGFTKTLPSVLVLVLLIVLYFIN